MAADAEDNTTVIRRKVTFGEVEVRPYFVTAGDNPGTPEVLLQRRPLGYL
jgi:hypothetical protein